MTGEQDSCDRCGQVGTVHVGWYSETGYDGLCDDCLRTAPRLDNLAGLV